MKYRMSIQEYEQALQGKNILPTDELYENITKVFKLYGCTTITWDFRPSMVTRWQDERSNSGNVTICDAWCGLGINSGRDGTRWRRCSMWNVYYMLDNCHMLIKKQPTKTPLNLQKMQQRMHFLIITRVYSKWRRIMTRQTYFVTIIILKWRRNK